VTNADGGTHVVRISLRYHCGTQNRRARADGRAHCTAPYIARSRGPL